MINHARTLLLNIFAQSANKQDAGYEYIPDSFRPLTLPNTLRVIRGVLFGSRPDQRFLNLRVRELLSYVHQTELVSYVHALDPRVTYWPEETSTEFKYQPSVTVQQVYGTPCTLSFSGEFVVSNSGGKALREYDVILSLSTVNSLVLTVTDTKDSVPVFRADGFVYDFTGDPPTATVYFKDLPVIELPETQIRLRVNNGQAPAILTDDEKLAKWHVKLAANPPAAITTLLPTLELLGEPVFLELFGVDSVEPYATFKNVWFDHPLPAYRIAGLVMAYIYRAEEVRKNLNA
jgi:hypothetical protein